MSAGQKSSKSLSKLRERSSYFETRRSCIICLNLLSVLAYFVVVMLEESPEALFCLLFLFLKSDLFDLLLLEVDESLSLMWE